MNILHFVPNFLPVCGGTTTRLYELLLDSRDNHYLYAPQAPSMYTPGFEKSMKETELVKGVNITRCRLKERFSIRIPFYYWLRYFRVNADILKNCVKQDSIDIVHAHNPMEFAIAGLNYAKEKCLPFIYEAHSLSVDAPTGITKERAPRFIVNLIKGWFMVQERKIFKCSDAVIVQTESMKQRIMELFNIECQKIEIVPNGVNTQEFNPKNWEGKGRILKEKMGWQDKIIFMYSGHLDHINGIDFLIDSLKGLPSDIRCRIKIVITGYGPLRERVEKARESEPDILEYLGVVDYADMPLYYSACDVFVIPRPASLSADNLISMKLLEAMAMEKIVLGSSVGGIVKLININNGIIFEKDNRNSLIEKIRYIVENIKDMDSLKKQAREDVSANNTWMLSRKRLDTVYNKLINKRQVTGIW